MGEVGAAQRDGEEEAPRRGLRIHLRWWCALLDCASWKRRTYSPFAVIGGAIWQRRETHWDGAARPGPLRLGGGAVNVPARQRQWFRPARLLIDHQAATSSTSVGSSSSMPVLLTRLDTGHMRNLSFAAEFSNSVPRSPLNQGPKSLSSRNTGMRS